MSFGLFYETLRQNADRDKNPVLLDNYNLLMGDKNPNSTICSVFYNQLEYFCGADYIEDRSKVMGIVRKLFKKGFQIEASSLKSVYFDVPIINAGYLCQNIVRVNERAYMDPEEKYLLIPKTKGHAIELQVKSDKPIVTVSSEIYSLSDAIDHFCLASNPVDGPQMSYDELCVTIREVSSSAVLNGLQFAESLALASRYCKLVEKNQ